VKRNLLSAVMVALSAVVACADQAATNMVLVPAGKFKFGDGADAREVNLDAYYIGRYEVTCAEYKVFLDATHYRGIPRYWKNGNFPAGKANHPVLFVSLVDAEAYCAWMSKKTGRKVVIPTAEQWEKAARGPKGWRYPWGDEKDSHYAGGKLKTRFNYNAVCAAHFLSKQSVPGMSISPDGNVTGWMDHKRNTGFTKTDTYRRLVEEGGFTTPVGSYENGKSAYGCYDMAGNAYEWTSTLITATNGAERGQRVNEIRGGSWYSTGRSGVSIGIGEGRSRNGGYHSVGFRIAMTP